MSRFHKGTHFSPKTKKEYKYRSSWEKKYMEYLDQNELIQEYDYECIKIPYIFRRKVSNYIPDFVIGGKLIVEIKPHNMLDRKRNLAKFLAATEYCQKNGMEFKVITERELKILNIL